MIQTTPPGQGDSAMAAAVSIKNVVVVQGIQALHAVNRAARVRRTIMVRRDAYLTCAMGALANGKNVVVKPHLMAGCTNSEAKNAVRMVTNV